jgi:hypothetical protein
MCECPFIVDWLDSQNEFQSATPAAAVEEGPHNHPRAAVALGYDRRFILDWRASNVGEGPWFRIVTKAPDASLV